jgi:hypothetical protein
VTYGTYDLTNQATAKNWPRIVTVVDMAWGTVLAAAVGAIGLTPGRQLAEVRAKTDEAGRYARRCHLGGGSNR